MHIFLRECVLVEGKDDINALAHVVQGLFFASRGLQTSADLVKTLQTLTPRIGLIILTDADGPGDRIRARFTQAIPQALQAHIPPKYSRDKATGRLGVAYAKPEVILSALTKAGAHLHTQAPDQAYSLHFLMDHGLASGPGAKDKRARFCRALGLGSLDGRQVLAVLNSQAFSPQDVHIALDLSQGGPLCP